MERRIQRHATRLAAAAPDVSYAAFQVGTRVMTSDGYPGRIAQVLPGPFGGNESYRVTLDNGLGGGDYAPSQLRALADSAPAGRDAHLPAGLRQAELGSLQADRADPLVAERDGRRLAEHVRSVQAEHLDDLQALASDDYPEMGAILHERPDPAGLITIIGARMCRTAAPDYAAEQAAHRAAHPGWSPDVYTVHPDEVGFLGARDYYDTPLRERPWEHSADAGDFENRVQGIMQSAQHEGGIKEPVEVMRGRMHDGAHRWEAARRLNIPLPIRQVGSLQAAAGVPMPGGQLKLFDHPHTRKPEDCETCGYSRHDPDHARLHLMHVQKERGDYEPAECEHCGGDMNEPDRHEEEHESWLHNQDWHTDWDAETPGDTLHRGIGMELPDGLHQHVHDASVPVHERAHALLKHVLRDQSKGSAHGGLGNFWSDNPDVSKTYAESATRRYSRGHDQTPVMIHAHTPGMEHIETDPDTLREWGVYSYHLAGNREVPIQNQAPLKIKGVSWAPPGHGRYSGVHAGQETPQHLHEDPAWTHHEFGGEGIRAHAAASSWQDRYPVLQHPQGGEPVQYFGTGLKQVRHPADMPAPLYHGSDAEFSPGDTIEAGHPGNFVRRMKHVYMTERPYARTDEPKAANGYGRHVYEVQPTGPYGHRSDAQGDAWATEDPLTVVRKVPDPRQREAAIYSDQQDSRDGDYNGDPQVGGIYWAKPAQQDFVNQELGGQQAAPPPMPLGMDDELPPVEAMATDWAQFHSKIPGEIHRGLYAPESHHVFSAPMSDEDIAHGLIAAHQEEHFPYERDRHKLFGTHWSSDENVAREFAHEHEQGHFSDDPDHDHDEHSEATPVVFHAQRPQRHEIEEDPRRLGWQNVDDYDTHEKEVPIRHGAPVRLTGVSWLKHTGLGPVWHRHDLQNPVELRAEDRDSPSDPDRWNASLRAEARYITTDEARQAARDAGWTPEDFRPGGRWEQERRADNARIDGLVTMATTINGTEIDKAGDAPHHGSDPNDTRAKNPDSYDGRSHEGEGDPKWDDPLPGVSKKDSNGAAIGMYPEGMEAGGGPGLEIGAFVAAYWNNDWDTPIPHTASREETSDRWHEFRNRYSEDLHRGIHVQLPDHIHRVVHDTRLPREVRAGTLQSHFQGSNLGMHWTPHVDIAHRSIGNAAAGTDDSDGGYTDDDYEDYDDLGGAGALPKTDVMFHIRPPGRNSVVRNRDVLEEHGVGYSHSPDEDETPIKPGSPVRMTGISWKEHEPDYPMEPYEHHDFAKPIRHTAKVPWTSKERTQLYSWDNDKGGEHGDFVSSHDFTNKRPDGFADIIVEPDQLQVEAALEGDDLYQHLFHHHRIDPDEIEDLRDAEHVHDRHHGQGVDMNRDYGINHTHHQYLHPWGPSSQKTPEHLSPGNPGATDVMGMPTRDEGPARYRDISRPFGTDHALADETHHEDAGMRSIWQPLHTLSHLGSPEDAALHQHLLLSHGADPERLMTADLADLHNGHHLRGMEANRPWGITHTHPQFLQPMRTEQPSLHTLSQRTRTIEAHYSAGSGMPEDEAEHHLRAHHGWDEARVQRARSYREQLSDNHEALHDTGMASHDHADPEYNAQIAREFGHERELHQRFGPERRPGAMPAGRGGQRVTDPFRTLVTSEPVQAQPMRFLNHVGPRAFLQAVAGRPPGEGATIHIHMPGSGSDSLDDDEEPGKENPDSLDSPDTPQDAAVSSAVQQPAAPGQGTFPPADLAGEPGSAAPGQSGPEEGTQTDQVLPGSGPDATLDQYPGVSGAGPALPPVVKGLDPMTEGGMPSALLGTPGFGGNTDTNPHGNGKGINGLQAPQKPGGSQAPGQPGQGDSGGNGSQQPGNAGGEFSSQASPQPGLNHPADNGLQAPRKPGGGIPVSGQPGHPGQVSDGADGFQAPAQPGQRDVADDGSPQPDAGLDRAGDDGSQAPARPGRDHEDGNPQPGNAGHLVSADDHPAPRKPGRSGSPTAALLMFRQAASSPSFRWEFTASWRDVMAKAKRIRTSGGVRITAVTASMVIGQVRGDHDVYECGVQSYPGRPQSVLAYSCGCPWASWHQDKDYPGRLNGRMCSHACALRLEAASRSAHGRELRPDPAIDMPSYNVVVKSLGPWTNGGWAQTWTAPSTLDPIMGARALNPGDMVVAPHLQAVAALTASGEDRDDVALLALAAGVHLGTGAFDEVNWDEIHPQIDEIHRGIGVTLPDHIHHQVHDRSRPAAERAELLMRHVGDGEHHGYGDAYGMGSHWSLDSRAAEDFAEHRAKYETEHENPQHHEWGSVPQDQEHGVYTPPPAPATKPSTAVVFHAHPPERDDIDEHAGDLGGVYHPFGHGEAEIPLRPGAEVHMKGVSWAPVHQMDDPRSWEGEDYEHHEFPHGTYHTAAANDPWGSNNYAQHAPQKPYGATSPPNAEMDPGSYGPLAGQDPEDWGSISDTSMTQNGLANEGSRRTAASEGDNPLQYPAIENMIPENQGTFPQQNAGGGPYNQLAPADPDGIQMGGSRHDPTWDEPLEPRTAAGRWHNQLNEATETAHANASSTGMHHYVYPVAGHGEAPRGYAQADTPPHVSAHFVVSPRGQWARVKNGSTDLWAHAPTDQDMHGIQGSGQHPLAHAGPESFGSRPDVRHEEDEYSTGPDSSRSPGFVASLGEPQLEGGLGAERHGEPEPALPETTGAEDQQDQQPGDQALMSSWGAQRRAAARAKLGFSSVNPVPDSRTMSGGHIPSPAGNPLDAATTGGGPGMSPHDEDLSPADPSIQTIGVSASEADIVARFQATAAASQFADGGSPARGGATMGDGDIAAQARAFLSKTGAAVFSPAEADSLISEGRGGTRARNLDLLDVKGTHYEENEDEMEKRGLSLDQFDDDLALM